MTPETVEQLKARLKRQDEEKEEAFKKRLERAYADNAGWRAEQAQKKRLEEQERERLHAGARESREQEMKKSALVSWESSGGTEAEFEEEWPSLRTEMLRRRTLEAETNARAAQRRSGVSSL
jgi:hypothetical protein